MKIFEYTIIAFCCNYFMRWCSQLYFSDKRKNAIQKRQKSISQDLQKMWSTSAAISFII